MTQFDNPEPTDSDVVSLLFETSPFGNIDAVVEHDQRAVYFYLNGKGTFGTKACWVRNLQPGPYVINLDEMKQGIPPLLPRTHCKYSDGRKAPSSDALEIVWLEEGNGAALFESGNLLAVVPPWSGMEGFHGYATECAAESQLCWPMPENPSLHMRLEKAREFWQTFQSAESNPFVELQTQVLDFHKKRFGPESSYFAIDGGAFPPRGLARFQDPELTTYATVGMSLCPQPMVEMQMEQPGDHRRVEIGIQFETKTLAENADKIDDLLKQISGLAAMPWKNWTWLGIGHTCGLPGLADFLGQEFQSAVLIHDFQIGGTRSNSISFRGDIVNCLWLIPISMSEQESIASGSVTALDLISVERLPKVNSR